MKNRDPGRGRGKLVRNSAILDGEYNTRTADPQSPDDFDIWKPLGDLVLADLRRIWWTQRRHHHVELPAEPGIIVLEGWPS